jgi:hypothetical protein
LLALFLPTPNQLAFGQQPSEFVTDLAGQFFEVDQGAGSR